MVLCSYSCSSKPRQKSDPAAGPGLERPFTAPFQINKTQRTTQEERNVRAGRFGPDKEFTVGADGERLAADKELRAVTVSVSSDV